MKPKDKTTGRFVPIDAVERFWQYVKKSDGCWEWTGHTSSGYGRLRAGRDSKSMGAHRFSFLLHGGQLLPGQVVCHRCDNRLCVRPEHLFAGSQNDNMQDMISKGRKARGEATASAKLTSQQVLEMRRLRAAGQVYRVIAERFGVHLSTVAYICRGKLWHHV